MRIISGYYRGRRIVPPTNLPVRPTTDMAKEALCNILTNTVDYESTRALDLFAGVGNISLELISRGCPYVLAIDNNLDCIKFIKETAKKFEMSGLLAMKADVFKFLDQSKAKFDLIFADPPYDNPDISKIPGLVFEKGLLNEGGIFILEHPKECHFEADPLCYDHRVYSRVNFSFFKQ